MSRTRVIPILGLIATAAIVVSSGCCPSRCCDNCPRQTVAYAIVDECQLEDANGCPVQKIRVPQKTPIEWTNRTQRQVQIHFDGFTAEWEGRELGDVVLQAGETKVTTTPGTISVGTCRVQINCEGLLPGPGPGIEECPPPPAKCP